MMLSQAYLDAIRDVYPALGGGGVVAACDWVIQHIADAERLDVLSGGITLSPGEVLQALNWAGSESERVTVWSSLDFLSGGANPLLRREFYYWPPGEEDTPETISLEEITKAINAGEFYCPRSRTTISDFKGRIEIAYATDSAYLRKLGVLVDG